MKSTLQLHDLGQSLWLAYRDRCGWQRYRGYSRRAANGAGANIQAVPDPGAHARYTRGAQTMPTGYIQPLYILPFDHCASFVSGMFGWSGALKPKQTAQITAAKRVIYDGFTAAMADGVDKDRGASWLTRTLAPISCEVQNLAQSSPAPPRRRAGRKSLTSSSATNSRGISWPSRRFCKVLVRYNPEGDAAMNLRQASRLRRLSEYLGGGPSRFMFELLVPATPTQLESLGGDVQAYDRKVRPALMLSALRELQDAGVEADVWKVDGLDSQGDCERIVAMARRDGRTSVGCIVLGRGENEQHVRAWLAAATGVPGFIGFAVGRPTFWEPLVALRDKKITREAAVAEIARRYRQWVDIFEPAKAAASFSDGAPATGLATPPEG